MEQQFFPFCALPLQHVRQQHDVTHRSSGMSVLITHNAETCIAGSRKQMLKASSQHCCGTNCGMSHGTVHPLTPGSGRLPTTGSPGGGPVTPRHVRRKKTGAS